MYNTVYLLGVKWYVAFTLYLYFVLKEAATDSKYLISIFFTTKYFIE